MKAGLRSLEKMSSNYPLQTRLVLQMQFILEYSSNIFYILFLPFEIADFSRLFPGNKAVQCIFYGRTFQS